MADPEAQVLGAVKVESEMDKKEEKETDKDMDKQTLLAVLQFLKKNNLQVRLQRVAWT